MNNDLPLLQSLFAYDSQTGLFRWVVSRAGGANLGFVKAVAGEPAGKVDPSTGYVRLRSHGKKWFAHRAAWALFYGEFPKQHIDHINGIKTDNRICNLRDVDRFVNQQNRRQASAKNKSTGVLGVRRQGKRFSAQITADGKHTSLGTFDDIGAGSAAYITAKRLLHRGNKL